MDKKIKLITFANVGGIIAGIYSLIYGLTKSNPYNFPLAEVIGGISLIVVCTMWVGLSLSLFRSDDKKPKLETEKQ